jgi:toxin FitB
MAPPAVGGDRRRRYQAWLRQQVLPAFGDRVLPFDVAAAEPWGLLMGEGERQGAVPSNDDAKIAAVAWLHGLMVVTANERHFAELGVPVVNPLTKTGSGNGT